VNPYFVNELVSMGFSQTMVINTLSKHKNDVNEALTELFTLLEQEKSSRLAESEIKSERKEDFLVLDERIYDPVNVSDFECPICFDNVMIGSGYVIEKCKHAYCLNCLKGYINEKILSGKVIDIRCPNPKCDQLFNYQDVKYIVDKQSFIKYEEFTLLAALKSDPSVIWCVNPRGCGNAIIIDPEQNVRRVRCGECGYDFCKLCNEEWHINSCEQYQQWKIDNNQVDEEFMKWSKENAKNCPNCKVRIQKMSGCNHMTCSNCQYQFCWICNKKI